MQKCVFYSTEPFTLCSFVFLSFITSYSCCIVEEQPASSDGKSPELSYLCKSKDTVIENDSSESHPVKYYLSKRQSIWF